MFHTIKFHSVTLDQPAPYKYAERSIDISAGPGYNSGAHVSFSYDDCHSSHRLYMTAEDARAVALKLLGAAMDAEDIDAKRDAGAAPAAA